MPKTVWKSTDIDGYKIWAHYSHGDCLVVDTYDLGDGTFAYALTCNFCYEVICSADPGEPNYRMLRYLYDIYKKGYPLSFDREGGRYGWVCYEKDGIGIRVARSKYLV